MFFSSSKNLMLVNERVLIIYPSDLFSVEFSSGISTTKVISTGSALCINLLCQENHKFIWRSQPIYLGNVRLSACVLFSSNTYRKLEKYFHILNFPWVWKSCYYDMFDHMLVLRNKLGRQNSYK